MLCGIGIKANLKDPKVHWVIKASNVVCHALITGDEVRAFVRERVLTNVCVPENGETLAF